MRRRLALTGILAAVAPHAPDTYHDTGPQLTAVADGTVARAAIWGHS